MALAELARSLFPGGSALLILPPFAGYERPSLGLHVLKAAAEAAGHRVDIFYANVHFAAVYGEDRYTDVCYAPTGVLSGEKVFAAAAFGERVPAQADPDTASLVDGWLDEVAAFVASLDYPVVGCNTMFEQLTCSLALLARIKALRPSVTTLLGGAQCEGEMADGILALGGSVDYVFGGESERTFVSFLASPDSRPPPGNAIHGEPLQDMESIPAPDFRTYFDQFALFCPESRVTAEELHWVPLEGSRGCWWGQKHHCTFCGINGMGMGYRMKSSDRLLSEIEEQVANTGCRNLLMVDNIMPHQYFSDLLPALAERRNDLRIFYEQKANLTVARMEAIAAAGIKIIQPGIESLSNDLLVLMNKGVKPWQNINALRYARMCDVYVNWNLLHSFPGDRAVQYEAMADIVPYLHHLCPPSGLNKLSIDRFSPYFDQRERYGIAAVDPMPAYREIFPADAPLAKLAYHFCGSYDSEALSSPSCLDRLEAGLNAWIGAWEDQDVPPVLSISELSDDLFLIIDTRQIAVRKFSFASRGQALAAIFGRHGASAADVAWCRERGFVVDVDGVAVPLAVPSARLFHALAGPSAERPQARLESETLLAV